MSQILSLFHEPDRNLRQRAMETVYQELSQHGQVLTFIYDTLIQDNLTVDRLRSYPHPMAQRHLSNEIDGTAVKTMMEVAEKNYPLAHDYFRLKAKLLELPQLALYDQYAPVGKEVRPFPYAKAQEVILDAFAAFDPKFRALAGEFFAKNWIDAEIRKGKRGGAFCASPSPKLHPYILCNYDDNLRDVMTVAHELGHGLHGCLSRKQNYFNYDTPLTTAETASVFGEMLVFDHLLDQQTDREVQIALLGRQDRRHLRHRVPAKCPDAIRRARVLGQTRKTANARRSRKTLARSQRQILRRRGRPCPKVTAGAGSYIPHFIHSRFYCYSYVFGQLLVLALYRMYKDEGKSFVPKYIALLEAGGSDTPDALLKPLGVDIHQPEFWQKGFEEIQGLTTKLRAII